MIKMKRRDFTLAAFLISGVLFFPLSSFAAEPASPEWNPFSPGPITTQPVLCPKGRFMVQPYIFYNHTRGAFNSEGHYKALPAGQVKDQYAEQLYLQYGITEQMDVDVFINYQQNYAKQDGLKARDNGVGDSFLWLRYRAFEEKGALPTITGLFQLKIPSGKFQHADPNKLGTDLTGDISGGGAWAPGFGISLIKKIKPFILYFDTIYSFPQNVSIDDDKARYGNFLNIDGAVEYILPKGFNLLLEVNGFLQGDTRQRGSRAPATDVKYLTVIPGLGWSCPELQVVLAYQRVAIGTNANANDSVVLTFMHTF
ncbi:MAG: transporter [Candidatus Omnitrophota bacterium]|nr:transporter [Candidatus Omnitrophota bacterium]